MKKFFVLALPVLSGLVLCGCSHDLEDDEIALLHAIQTPAISNTDFQEKVISVSNLDYYDRSGMTPLEYAVRRQDAGKIKMLLDSGADPYFVDGKGYTAYHFAAAMEKPDVLNLLIEKVKCKNVDIRAEDGRTPLMEAARNGRMETVAILLKKGAEVNAADKQGRTPLTFAAMAKYNSLELTKLLLANKAEKLTDEPQAIPLLVAIANHNTDTADYLLDRLPDFNQGQMTDLAGFVAMRQAIFSGDVRIVKKIIQKKLPLNAPLGMIYRGMDIVDMEGIYQALADLNVVDDGRTPIFWAAEAEQPEIVTLLAENGADPQVFDHNGNRPDQYARKKATVQAFKDLK